MEPEARYTVVGAILVSLVVAAAFAFVWLSRAGVASEFRFYTIHFEQQSLEGLQVGGDVNMQGIKVGRVEGFSIDRDNINRVNVTVRVARRTPVSTNTTAVVARNLVTGIARINLETPRTPGPELVEVLPNEDYPVIAEGTSDIEQFTRTANSLVISAEATLGNLSKMLSDDNRKAFGQVLTGIRDLTVGLNKRLDSIDHTTAALNSTVRAFEVTARAFQKQGDTVTGVVERVGAQFVPVAREAEAALRGSRDTLRETETTMREMQVAMRELASATRTLERDVGALVRRTDDVADLGLLELRATAHQLRGGVELLSRTLDRLQDPRSALLGPAERRLGPGESTK